jgi:hypothetical protein
MTCARSPVPRRAGVSIQAFRSGTARGRILVSWTQCRLFDTVDPTRIVPCTADRLADPNGANRAAALQHLDVHALAEHSILPIMPPVEGVMVTEASRRAAPRAAATVILDKDCAARSRRRISLPRARPARHPQRLRHHGARTRRATKTVPAAGAPSTIASVSNPGKLRRVQQPSRCDSYASRSGVDPRRRRYRRSRQLRVRSDRRDARDRRLRSGRARWLGAHESARQRAFQISLLDVNGRRVESACIAAWLSVRPGEVLECNGCHVRTKPRRPTKSHGRQGSFNAVYAGATATGRIPRHRQHISRRGRDTMARARRAPVRRARRIRHRRPSMRRCSRSRRAPTWSTTRSGSRRARHRLLRLRLSTI